MTSGEATSPGWAPGLPSRRYHYLTARCPLGCGWWSIPPSVDRHIARGTCPLVPWVFTCASDTLVANGERVELLALLPPELKRKPDFADRTYFPLGGDPILRAEVMSGIAVASPVPAVPARRWLAVTAAAFDRYGPSIVTDALDPDRYPTLEAAVALDTEWVACPMCGDWVRQRGLRSHQSRSTRCRWLAAHRTVEAARADGWRDPWSAGPHVPLKWAELNRAPWRRQLQLVRYPLWTAILIPPKSERPAGDG